MRVIDTEKEIEKTIIKKTDTIFPENRKKGEIASKLISQLGFFDRRTQRLEKEGKAMLERC